MKHILLMIGGVGEVLAAQYLGSYTARISDADHYSSRGAALTSVSEILRQDRANNYLFGRGDSEDQTVGYFRSRAARARLSRMLRYGSIPRNLSAEIRHHTPLIRVDIYIDHIEVDYATGSAYKKPAPKHTVSKTKKPEQTLSVLLEQDARTQVATYARSHTMGFSRKSLKHWVVGTYFSREGEQDIAWVVYATSPKKNFICHACAPMLSVLVYRKRDARIWKLREHNYEAYQGGSGWDNPPGREDMALVHLAADKCALAIRTGYANMGWGMQYYGLLSIVDGKIKNLFYTTLSEDNGAVGGRTLPTNWRSTLKIEPGTTPYYDIQLHREGIDKGKSIDYTVIYRYNISEYQPIVPDKVMTNTSVR